MANRHLFDEYYFAHNCGRPYQRDEHWLNFFDGIAKRIIEEFQPQSVLDAGCAWGFLVEAFRKRGVEAYGVDISEYALQNVHPDIKPYCWVGSITQPFGRKFDLITCIEVLEHLLPDEVPKAIENLCQHANQIIFSSTPFDFKEATHFSVHDPEYWAAQFARHGFYRDLDTDLSYITPWAVRFVNTQMSPMRLVQAYERRLWLLTKENVDLRQASVEGEAQVRDLRKQVQQRGQEISVLSAHIKEKEREIGTLAEQVKEKDGAILALSNQIHEIMESEAWLLSRLLTRILSPFAPPGSKRNRIAKRLAKVAWTWRSRGRKEALKLLSHSWQQAFSRITDRDDYQRWQLANEPKPSALARQHKEWKNFSYQPLISIITPVYNPPPAALRDTIESVLAQTYPHWELWLIDGKSTLSEVRELLEEVEKKDQRIHVVFLEENLGISGNTNEGLKRAQGDFVAFLDHDDLLAPNMLYEVVDALNQDPHTDIVYFDEDKISADGQVRKDPWFKPRAWSPDLLLSVNYLMHSVFRRSLLQEVGGFDPQMDGAQDWDLALRCTEKTQKIRHIPKVLYHWRQVPGSAAAAADAKPWAFRAQINCVQSHLQRLGVQDAQVVSPSLGQIRVLWPATHAKVSIIIPTKDKVGLLHACLSSLLTITSYPDYEIILVDTGSVENDTWQYYDSLDDPRVKIVKFKEEFNYSKANNFGVQHASGEILLFLNNDTQILAADWLTELAGWASRPEVGAVGCKLLRPDGTIQHAGIIIGLEGHGSHVFEGNPESYYGPFGSSEWYRDYQAVTGACMCMRREVFEQVNGFDPAYQIGYGDIDLCLRVREKGYRVVYTPFARLLHHEGGTRGLSLPASDVLRASIKMYDLICAGDAYFNPNLSYMKRKTAIALPDEETREERLFRILTQYGLVNPNTPHTSLEPGDIPDRDSFAAASPNLLFITHDLSRSGAPILLHALGRKLSESYQITVLSPVDGPLKEEFLRNGINVVVHPAALDDARVIAQVAKEYDCVVANTILAWRAIYAALAMERPCIWWIHESRFGAKLATENRQVGNAFKAASKVIFPANKVADLYRPFLPTNEKFVCLPFFDLEYLQDRQQFPQILDKQPDRKYVVCIGSIEPRKGQDILLESLSLLPEHTRSKLEVYFIGRTLAKSYYHRLVRQSRKWKNVHFIGEVPHETALAYLAQADIFVLPSRDEVLPVTLLEAMFFGKTIIASNVGGIGEVITHGNNGLLVEPGNPQSLADQLTFLCSEEAKRHALGKRAQTTIHHLTEETDHEFIKILETVCSHNPA